MTGDATAVSPDEFVDHVDRLGGDHRKIVAIAGAPGSGKSTFAELLVDRLNRDKPNRASVLPMDGFHFDDLVLNARGHRPRKGAPHTFDIGGLSSILDRLRKNDEPFVAVPIFDRSIEIARAGARIIERGTDIIVVEGNYLLLDDLDWAHLRGHFDLTALLEIPEAILRERLTNRWIELGLQGEELRTKLEENDFPNMLNVVENSVAPDYLVVSNPTW